MEKAFEMLDVMLNNGVVPDVYTYNSLLNGSLQNVEETRWNLGAVGGNVKEECESRCELVVQRTSRVCFDLREDGNATRTHSGGTRHHCEECCKSLCEGDLTVIESNL
ncbi:hypothetical protein Bca4012_027873 [Brassica carinata]